MASRYQTRTENLKKLGFDSYKEYLASDLWRTIRQSVMDRDKCCRTCRKPAYTAHHVTYSLEVLKGEDLSQLISTCKGCHYDCEFEDGKKLVSTTKIAKRLRKRAYRAIGGSVGKGVIKKHLPKCVVCKKQYKILGRNDICMPCHRKGLSVAP